MRERLLSQAQDAVQAALDVGADDVVAGVARGRSIDFRWRDGKLEKVQENTASSLNVRLYVDGRYSTHATNDLDGERLKDFLQEAVDLTRFLERDPYREIPDPALYDGRAEIDLDLVDPAVDDLTRDGRIGWCKDVHAEATDHADVISATSGVTSGSSQSARASSNGFAGTHESTGVWYGVEVTARDGETKRPAAWRWVGGAHCEGLPTPREVGREGLARVLARQGASKAESVRTTMIVHPEAGAPLIGRIFGALTAAAIQQKQSFLAEKRGERIGSPLFTLTDEPHLKRASGSCLYDSEGIATRPRPIVSAGVLDDFFVDTYYGKKLGWTPTGGSLTNIAFRHGEHDLAGVLREAGEGIYVTSWMGGNADMTTGNFSFGIQGHVVENGEIGRPVGEMNVTGNYLELLERLAIVGNDPEPWAVLRSPTLAFENVQFSGV